MSTPHYIAQHPERETWDVVVVGTGMGGATLGHALAARGHRVLFLEKGLFLYEGADRGDGALHADADEAPAARLRRGLWPYPLSGRTSFGQAEFFAPLGCGSGGSTGLYAAQLERFLPADFRPREHYPCVGESTLPAAWPIAYEELLPYYRRAEALYRVRGTPDPLDPGAPFELLPPPPLSERDRHIEKALCEAGLHPYRAHVGFDFIEDCHECGGVLCPRACKSDAGRICLLPALRDHGAQILPSCEVVKLEADAERVSAVVCRHEGRQLHIRGRIVVLAAGAWMTPVVLLNSRGEHWPEGLANGSGQVGRNLMMHVSDFIAVAPRAELSTRGPKKALALNDFYLDESGKLGTLQSVGVAVGRHAVLYYLHSRLSHVPRWLRWLLYPLLQVAARIGDRLFRSSAVFSTIVEDLPYSDNRVLPDPDSDNGMRFEYEYKDELRERSLRFRKRVREVLKPHHRLMVLSGANNLNYGHVCGTCRFGDDPQRSVLDRNNRAHEVDNLYVVDASFFPSSGGTNPSLTIAANALRVADAIDKRLR